VSPEDALAALGWTIADDRRGPVGRFVDAGDQTYHVLEAGSADASPLVLLHGGGPGCTGWTDFGQVAPLFAADHRVILVDLLQYGRSSKPHITEPMWDFHVRHLIALFDALGLRAPNVVCNSWGGTQALTLAAQHPSRVTAMSITGSMPVFHGPMSPLLDRSKRGRVARLAYYGGDGPTLDKMRTLMGTFEWFDETAVPDLTVELRYVQSLQADEIDCGENPANRGTWQDIGGLLAQVMCPTLFAWGMYDGFLTPDYPLMCANLVANGHLHVMAKASHHLQEERPEEFHAVVQAFLGQHGGGAS
jgi:2-hydroxy-6-oxonona-2,4-dienedioate hydrolase